jgi:hypothetical protein
MHFHKDDRVEAGGRGGVDGDEEDGKGADHDLDEELDKLARRRRDSRSYRTRSSTTTSTGIWDSGSSRACAALGGRRIR